MNGEACTGGGEETEEACGQERDRGAEGNSGIIEALNTISMKSFVSSVKVNEI
jgi:hypothetical protein